MRMVNTNLAGPYRAALESIFAGKKVIVTGRFIAELVPRARKLRDLGATSTFLLATAGMGAVKPSEEDGPYFNINETSGANSHEREQELLGNLPPDARAALDVF